MQKSFFAVFLTLLFFQLHSLTAEGVNLCRPSWLGEQRELNIFFSGRRNATLEPCGCKRGQKGGLKHEPYIYNRYSSDSLVRLDVGGWACKDPNPSPMGLLRTRYLLRGLGLLEYDAVNIGAVDTLLSKTFFSSLQNQYPDGLPFLISANVYLKSMPEVHAFPTHRIIYRTMADGCQVTLGVTGVAAPLASVMTRNKSDFLIKPVHESLVAVLNELRPQTDILIVLFDGDFSSGVELAGNFPQIDFLIATGDPGSDVQRPKGSEQNNVLPVSGSGGSALGFLMLQLDPEGKRWNIGSSKIIDVQESAKPECESGQFD